MNRNKSYDRGVLLIVLLLLGFGLAIVFSASAVISRELYGSQSRIFLRQLLYVLLGFTALVVTLRLDYHFYQRPGFVYGLLTLTMILLLAVLLLPEARGTHRFIRWGSLSFQPSELAKLAVIFFTSYHVVSRREEFQSLWGGLLPCLAVLGATVSLVLMGSDLGTAVCIAATGGFLLYISGLRYRYILTLALAAVPIVYLLIVRVPYRLERVLAFLNPLQDPYGIGYQTRQSLISVGSGGWTGLGFAEGKQQLFFLPEPHTDFIFAVVGEELGFLGCGLLLILFALFFWRGVRISLRADTPFGTLVGLGIVCMIVLQAFANMSVAVSLLPTKGMPLPFVSFGGSSMLVMLTGVGILLNISRHSGIRNARWK